jgi:hypothetical protein
MAKAMGWEVKGIQLKDVGPDHFVVTITDPKSTIHQITYYRLKGRLWQGGKVDE